MYKTVVSVIIMIVAGVVGLFLGTMGDDPFGGATLFALIAGIAYLIHTLDNKEKDL